MMRKLRHGKRRGEYNLCADNYETPKVALEMVLAGVPKGTVLWDPFYCTGQVRVFFRELGYTCINENRDFFEYEPFLYEVIVTNPPYSIKHEVLIRLLNLGRPFAVLMPITTLTTHYFYQLMRRRSYQVIIPSKRFNFLRGDERLTKNKACTFSTVWITVGFEGYLGTTQQIIHRTW